MTPPNEKPVAPVTHRISETPIRYVEGRTWVWASSLQPIWEQLFEPMTVSNAPDWFWCHSDTPPTHDPRIPPFQPGGDPSVQDHNESEHGLYHAPPQPAQEPLTRGIILGEELRQKCNKLTPEERANCHKIGMDLIAQGQPAQEWMMLAAAEVLWGPSGPMRPDDDLDMDEHIELSKTCAIIQKHAPVPAGDAAVKGLVERLGTVHEWLNYNDRIPDRVAVPSRQAITDAITALESLARENERLKKYELKA